MAIVDEGGLMRNLLLSVALITGLFLPIGADTLKPFRTDFGHGEMPPPGTMMWMCG
jgi:hypothetical protein